MTILNNANYIRTRGEVKHDMNYWFNYWLMWHPVATRVIIVVITVIVVTLLVLLFLLAIIYLYRCIHYSRTYKPKSDMTVGTRSNAVVEEVNTFPRPRNAHVVFIRDPINPALHNTWTYCPASYRYMNNDGTIDSRHSNNPWVNEHWILYVNRYGIYKYIFYKEKDLRRFVEDLDDYGIDIVENDFEFPELNNRNL